MLISRRIRHIGGRVQQVLFVLRHDPKKLVAYANALARRLVRRARQSSERRRPPATLATTAAVAGLDPDRWCANVGLRDRVYVGIDDARIEQLQQLDPQRVAATLITADRVLRHEFRFLSAESWRSVDPNRTARADGYVPIDWYADPVQDLRFPERISHKEWDLYGMRPGLADIKLPWELSRCQHWAVLGQAYRFSGDERYAREIVHQLDDFVESNPVGMGVNWTCTMDVAIRAANWVIGLALIEGSDALDAAARRRTLEELFRHGQFIFDNLENVHEVTSNHFLSDLVGLFFVASVFRELPEGKTWAAFCRRCLEEEIVVQVLPDGADFESSIPYHRLVAELFLGAARLAAHSGQPLTDAYHDRLRTMIDYMAGVLRPDGLMPQVGDADDGRLHILTDYGTWDPQDPRHLFGPAGTFFETDAWSAYCTTASLWESSWWGFASAGGQEPDGRWLPDHAQLYPHAGTAVIRRGGNYLLVTNSIVGTEGFGNHKHNDLLGFEYHVGGVPFLVDPGSYVYTSDPEARNRFRSTAHHNTLQVDDLEQNELRAEWLFRMFESAEPQHDEFEVDSMTARYTGSHGGYERADAAVRHQRRFQLDTDTGLLQISDRLQGAGAHTLRWHFHCAPGIEVCQPDGSGGVLTLTAPAASLVLEHPEELDVEIVDDWYSPAYGVRVPCRAINLRMDVLIDGAFERGFTLRTSS